MLIYAIGSWNSSDSEIFGIQATAAFPPDQKTPQLLRHILIINTKKPNHQCHCSTEPNVSTVLLYRHNIRNDSSLYLFFSNTFTYANVEILPSCCYKTQAPCCHWDFCRLVIVLWCSWKG